MSASDKQRKVRRLIVIVGGGISGLFAALQAYDNDCDVVILEESTSVGGNVAQQTSLQIVTDLPTFLKENPNVDASLEYTELPKLLEKYNFNVNDDSKFQSTASNGSVLKTLKDNSPIGTALLDALNHHIPSLASFRFRIIRNAHATHLLFNKDKDTVVGVHYDVSYDQKSISSVDIFCDAVILATGATHPNIAQVDLFSTKGLFATGSLVASSSLLNTLLTALFAAKSAATFTGHRSQYGVVCQPDFVDSNGVFHETALHPQKWTLLKLREKFQNNKTTFTFRFDLPSPSSHLGLLAGQYIALKATLQGQEVVRYYSPISRSSDYGKVELLVKIEPEKMRETSMTNYLYGMNVGDGIEFKGPLGGFEYHRNMYREIGLVAGGTGISPMMQIIRSVTAHPEDKTKIKLLYGNYVEDDILCKEELFYISSTRDNVDSFVTLCTPPPRWSLGIGFINENMMKEHLPAPANDIKIVLCGPPGMIKAMIPTLKALGYTDEMLFSYV